VRRERCRRTLRTGCLYRPAGRSTSASTQTSSSTRKSRSSTSNARSGGTTCQSRRGRGSRRWLTGQMPSKQLSTKLTRLKCSSNCWGSGGECRGGQLWAGAQLQYKRRWGAAGATSRHPAGWWQPCLKGCGRQSGTHGQRLHGQAQPETHEGPQRP